MEIYEYTIDNQTFSTEDISLIPDGVGYIIKEVGNYTQEQLFLRAIEDESNLYEKRIQDGIKAVSRLSAKLRVAKLNGIINEQDHKGIDALLVPIRTEVLAGQWIGAKDLLIELGPSQIGQSLYDELMLELTNYINVNY